MSVEHQVRDHFHGDARRFDAIYDEDKGPLDRFVDNVWRGVVRRRLDLTLAHLEPLAGKSILDIGCGSGRYCLECAQRGAGPILGVDFAPAMIKLANEYASRLGVDDRCEFRVGTFPMDVGGGPYDVSLAMGFFDYIQNPKPLLTRMRELTRSTMVMSFPRSHEWRVPIRRLRFRMLGCPLFLYSEPQVRELLRDAGVGSYDWIPLDRDYLVVAHV